jgi:hypothetical protein
MAIDFAKDNKRLDGSAALDKLREASRLRHRIYFQSQECRRRNGWEFLQLFVLRGRLPRGRRPLTLIR